MLQFVVSLLLCIPALAAGMQLSDSGPEPLTPGANITRDLPGNEQHRYTLAVAGMVRIRIDNLGRGTILTVENAPEAAILRAANWRGPEHHYSAVLEVDPSVTLVVSADESIAPAGRYRISIEAMSSDDPEFSAERAMFHGANYRLQHYFGAADARPEALERFQFAADQFEALSDNVRRADALFEAAGVLFSTGANPEAIRHYEQAKEIWTELGDQTGIATAEMQRGLLDWRTNRPLSAIQFFRQAAARRRASGNDFFYAQALNNMGLVYRELGDARNAVDFCTQALEIWQGSIDLLAVDPANVDFNAAVDPPWLRHTLIAMNNIAWASDVLADVAKTEIVLIQGLSLASYLGLGRNEAELRANLGGLRYTTGDLQSALVELNISLNYFTNISKNEIWAGNVHHTLGQVYRAAGDVDRAKIEFDAALALRTAERDPIGRADTVQALGELHLQSMQVDETLAIVESALSLLGDGNANHMTRAALHDLAGRATMAGRQPAAAIAHFGEAVSLYMTAGDLRGEARARANRAIAHQAQGIDFEAVAGLRIARTLAIEVNDRLLQFRVLTAESKMFRENGDLDAARDKATAALEISDNLREELIDPVLLREFSSTQRDAFDVLVSVALARGDIETAWELADRARARRFGEILGQTGIDKSLLSETQLGRYQSLIHMRAARTLERTTLLADRENQASSETQEYLATIRVELASIVDEIEQIRERSRVASAEGLPDVELQTVQAALADNETVLEYYISELGSGVWSIRSNNFSYRSLDGLQDFRADLTIGINSFRSPNAPQFGALARLSRSLLGTSSDIGASATHLIIVPDGPLFYLPFSLLLDPEADPPRVLVDTRDVSYLPSVKALFELRARNQTSGAGIAVVADPVFDLNDPRIRQMLTAASANQIAAGTPDLERGSRDGAYQRLPRTLAEYEEIKRVAENIKVDSYHSTSANRANVVSGALNHYNIVHFATHGVLDAEEPALSSLVLSVVTENGTQVSRFLRSQDIAALNLQADLVVLSGCDTGSGQLVRGEGLIGLSRAFFYAGANQVVSSLWKVPDQATTALMGQFYFEMFHNNLSPSKALRQAKLSIRENPLWRNPYYWAAFIVQGDWNHPIAR